ncbi:hypothetical protein MATL_G00119770 [Megalops atlanticus]|uniref:Ret finger protein-like 4B n=1 Tax=Megalops atlanticus TaxID=7932 RepID=A0A9D3T890_MEGAT|nr:hypothetical protein MATL_G00119770 [Megalops atlanticus]
MLQTQNINGATEEKVEVWGISEELSVCPSCGRDFDVPLLLPCSHTLCRSCIEAVARSSGEGSPGTAPGLAPALLCPCCRLSVELPCWEWAGATRCLPLNPALAQRLGTPETGRDPDGGRRSDMGSEGDEEEDASRKQGDTKTTLQDERSCVDAGAVPGWATLYEYAGWPQGGAVDLLEEEMEQSVSGLLFTLDPSTAAPSLALSGSALTVTFQGESALPHPAEEAGLSPVQESRESCSFPQVCAAVVITRGQYYWEADVCNSTCYRIGVISVDEERGWWLERRGTSFCAMFDERREPLSAVPPQMKTVGVFLNMGGGALSFHNALTQEHLATLPSCFSPGVRPALGLGRGRLRLRCGLPPPPHVFLCRSSIYRGPAGAGGGRWRRDVRFQSVRSFIQKFEELAASDSDSGLVSSFGSSCSTLASLPDPSSAPRSSSPCWAGRPGN